MSLRCAVSASRARCSSTRGCCSTAAPRQLGDHVTDRRPAGVLHAGDRCPGEHPRGRAGGAPRRAACAAPRAGPRPVVAARQRRTRCPGPAQPGPSGRSTTGPGISHQPAGVRAIGKPAAMIRGSVPSVPPTASASPADTSGRCASWATAPRSPGPQLPEDRGEQRGDDRLLPAAALAAREPARQGPLRTTRPAPARWPSPWSPPAAPAPPSPRAPRRGTRKSAPPPPAR